MIDRSLIESHKITFDFSDRFSTSPVDREPSPPVAPPPEPERVIGVSGRVLNAPTMAAGMVLRTLDIAQFPKHNEATRNRSSAFPEKCAKAADSIHKMNYNCTDPGTGKLRMMCKYCNRSRYATPEETQAIKHRAPAKPRTRIPVKFTRDRLPDCEHGAKNGKKVGTDRYGRQRWKCTVEGCGRTVVDD